MTPTGDDEQGAALYRTAKRAMDLLLALIAGTVALPFLPLIALLIKLESPGRVLFWHQRLGKHGRLITIPKFRTMVENAPDRFQEDGSRLVTEGDARVTRIGRWLRGGADEIPQILSVLRGELSFVGPRPDDAFVTEMYRGAEWLKLGVIPGISGLAQVSGRTNIPWRDRLKYDIYYAAHPSVWLDLRIVVRTVLHAAGIRGGTPLVAFSTVDQFAESPKALGAAARIRAIYLAESRP